MTKFFFKFKKNPIFNFCFDLFPQLFGHFFQKDQAAMHNFRRMSDTMPTFREI